MTENLNVPERHIIYNLKDTQATRNNITATFGVRVRAPPVHMHIAAGYLMVEFATSIVLYR